MYDLLAAVAAYLIGSVSFAVLVSAAMGLADPRSYGSKNPGATNVLRGGNKIAAALTLLGDAFKGWFAVWSAARAGAYFGLDDRMVALAALGVFVGHVYPVWFRFKGGKGVATAAGVLFAIYPLLGGAALLTWVIVAFFFRYSSLAALAAAVFAPFSAFLMFGARGIVLAVATLSVLLIWRHQLNIQRLLRGEESRIGGKHEAASAAGTDRP